MMPALQLRTPRSKGVRRLLARRVTFLLGLKGKRTYLIDRGGWGREVLAAADGTGYGPPIHVTKLLEGVELK